MEGPQLFDSPGPILLILQSSVTLDPFPFTRRMQFVYQLPGHAPKVRFCLVCSQSRGVVSPIPFFDNSTVDIFWPHSKRLQVEAILASKKDKPEGRVEYEFRDYKGFWITLMINK